VSDPFLALLHLCDSLFPIGAFSYSDGLEAAAARLPTPRLARFGTGPERSEGGKADTTGGALQLLAHWTEAILADTIGLLEGPVVWSAWRAFRDENWDGLAALDEEVTALRPASATRRSSRAMGLRLLATWSTLYPDPRLARTLTVVRDGGHGPTLPVAFASACASSGIERRRSVEAFAYTRLAATISCAMRLMPVGQTDAHHVLARSLEGVPAVIDDIERRAARPSSFAPALDVAGMEQQYLHSRLFRS